ncbi:MAG: type II CAAX endopeptidase family protein [Pseudomonadota bacterium]
MEQTNYARLAAAGSLDWPVTTARPRLARRVWLICELGLFYIGVPLLMSWAIFAWHIPLVYVLQPLLIGFIAYLLWDDTFRIRREFSRGFSLRQLCFLLLTFLVVGGAITLATYFVFPHLFLGFPLYATEIWLIVMVLYPLLSVVAQELVFRTFFFHRYGPLFKDAKWLAVVSNGLLFGFAHIIFGNIIAVVGTAVIGFVLAYRYYETRSFWAVWLEHSLFGCLVFTVGLGRFFFTGVSNFG